MTVLVDANILIALVLDDHVHHERATSWVLGAGAIAGCPVVEGALVRFLVRAGESASTAGALVKQLRTLPSYEWWPDDVSYGDVDLRWVSGHRQVTDAYLVGLAQARSSVLATLDERLSRAHPDGVALIP